MQPWIAWLIAIISTAACLTLWFRDVRRIIRERLNTVESAAEQLASCRKRAAEADPDGTTAEILARSEHIYQQAVELYNRTIRKPKNFLPAYLMGFRPAQGENLPERSADQR